MSNFDDRKRAEEARMAMNAEMQFKIAARRNKLLGLWAAQLMNMTGADADAYAKTVVIADLEEVGDDDVFRKVRGDFDTKGVNRTDAEIREQMADLMPVAQEQVLGEQG